MTIAEIIDAANKIERDEIKIDEIVDGMVDPEEGEDVSPSAVAPASTDSDDDEEEEEDAEEEEEEEEASTGTGAAAGYSAEQLEALAAPLIKNGYGQYLHALAKRGSVP